MKCTVEDYCTFHDKNKTALSARTQLRVVARSASDEAIH